jgi:hypothetical protein
MFTGEVSVIPRARSRPASACPLEVHLNNDRMNERTTDDQPMQLLWAPPRLGDFVPEDTCRFRLILNHRGWCTGLVWCAHESGKLLAKAGTTWNVSTNTSELWNYFSECAASGVNGSDAYDAVIADTPDAWFSDEFWGTGAQLEQARLWMQSFNDDEVWSRGVALPPRASRSTWPDPEVFKFYASYELATRKPKALIAGGPPLLLREDEKWWVVPERDYLELIPGELVEVRPRFRDVYDRLGLGVLRNRAVVAAFASDWMGDLWAGARQPVGDQAEMFFASNEHDDPLGLILLLDGVEYVRGEGRWFGLPRKALFTRTMNMIDVGVDFIACWDELEKAATLEPTAAWLAHAVPMPPVPSWDLRA